MSVSASRPVALVSGAAGGIGRAINQRLATCCSTLILFDMDESTLTVVAADLQLRGVRVLTAAVDVADIDAVRAAVERCVGDVGSLDIVVAAAGHMDGAPVADLSSQAWAAVIGSHLTGSFAVVQAAIPALRRSRRGSVVLVSSVAAAGIVGHANYGAAKAGVEGLTRTLAAELGPDGIRVNAVAPGFIDTPMTRTAAQRKDVSWDDYTAPAAAGAALRRIGSSDEVAAVVGFLAGPDSSYVTGQVIKVAGSI